MRKSVKKVITGTVLMSFLMGGVPSFASEGSSPCISEEKALEVISGLVGPNVGLKRVAKAEPVSGFDGKLCEVVVEADRNYAGGRYTVFYTDNAGKFIILGQVFDADTKKNLTREILQKYNTWTKEMIDEAKNAAFKTIGEGEQEVIFFTDPLCPFCKSTLPVIEELAERGVKVHVVLVPLHGDKAKKIAQGIICENRPVSEIHSYTPPEDSKSCEKADQLIDTALKIFTKNGVGGTPAMVSAESGIVHLGMVKSADDLAQIFRLKLKERKKEDSQTTSKQEAQDKQGDKQSQNKDKQSQDKQSQDKQSGQNQKK